MRFPSATRRNIYVRSRRAGERVMASVSRFLTNKLRLKVNEAKSAVARPVAARRLIVITPRAGVTVLDSLLAANGVDPTSVDSPSPPMEFPASAVYLVDTRSHSSR